MSVPPLLLELLVCPRCRRRPALDEHAGELVCDGCALAYAVQDGVPVMDPGHARVLTRPLPRPGR